MDCLFLISLWGRRRRLGVAFQRLRNFKECSGLSMNFSFRISWVQFGSLRNVTKSGAKSQTKEVLVSIHLLSDKTHLHKANVARKISQRYTDTSTYACLMEFHFNLKEIWFYLFEPASPEDKLDFSFSSWVPLFFFGWAGHSWDTFQSFVFNLRAAFSALVSK